MKICLDDPILRQQPHFVKTTTLLQPPYSVFLKSNSGSFIVDYLFIYYLFLVITAQISSLSK